MSNDFVPRKKSSTEVVESEVKSKVDVGWLTVDGEGNEVGSPRILAGYEAYKDLIENDMRTFARKSGMLK
jgi:hypothetical protein